MRLVLQSLSSRWLRLGLVAFGVIAFANASATAYANCSEFVSRAQRRDPIRWMPRNEQGAYRLVTVAAEESEASESCSLSSTWQCSLGIEFNRRLTALSMSALRRTRPG